MGHAPRAQQMENPEYGKTRCVSVSCRVRNPGSHKTGTGRARESLRKTFVMARDESSELCADECNRWEIYRKVESYGAGQVETSGPIEKKTNDKEL